jgi:hypothetical protein
MVELFGRSKLFAALGALEFSLVPDLDLAPLGELGHQVLDSHGVSPWNGFMPESIVPG